MNDNNMEKLIAELRDIDWMTCEAMKKWDGVDIAKVPKEFHGYRAIFAKVDGLITMLGNTPASSPKTRKASPRRRGW